VIRTGSNFCEPSRTSKGCSRFTTTSACRITPIAHNARFPSRRGNGSNQFAQRSFQLLLRRLLNSPQTLLQSFVLNSRNWCQPLKLNARGDDLLGRLLVAIAYRKSKIKIASRV